MAFMDMKGHQEQHKFDWDNINVGNIQLDHSENFFSNKHYEHEKFDEMEFLQQKMVKTEIIDTVEQKSFVDGKKTIENCSTPDVKQDDKETETSNTSPSIAVKEEYVESTVNGKEKLQDRQEPCRKVAANLACEWSTRKPVCSQVLAPKAAVSKNMRAPPHAYLVKDIYQRKREEAERRRAEEEQKLREFHSRPAPKFNHEQLQKPKIVHAVTVPITPQVLKKSQEVEEKRRKRLDEWKEKNKPPKFEPRAPTVLKEKPFIPVKKPIVVQQRPFNLHMEKRLQERKHYNEIKQKALEEKHKQVEIEEEERKRLEKERIKELRKAAAFKARPNPFKN